VIDLNDEQLVSVPSRIYWIFVRNNNKNSKRQRNYGVCLRRT